VLELIEDAAPHGFLLYWTNDVHPVMQLAGDGADCISYLMGNVTIAERMFQHDPRVTPYAPLHTVIWEDAAGQSWFTADQPSTQFGSFGIPEVTSVGVELDRKLAALLETLDVEVPTTLLSEHAISPDSCQWLASLARRGLTPTTLEVHSSRHRPYYGAYGRLDL
jgi:Domain of unknown function DUF302